MTSTTNSDTTSVQLSDLDTDALALVLKYWVLVDNCSDDRVSLVKFAWLGRHMHRFGKAMLCAYRVCPVFVGDHASFQAWPTPSSGSEPLPEGCYRARVEDAYHVMTVPDVINIVGGEKVSTKRFHADLVVTCDVLNTSGLCSAIPPDDLQWSPFEQTVEYKPSSRKPDGAEVAITIVRRIPSSCNLPADPPAVFLTLSVDKLAEEERAGFPTDIRGEQLKTIGYQLDLWDTVRKLCLQDVNFQLWKMPELLYSNTSCVHKSKSASGMGYFGTRMMLQRKMPSFQQYPMQEQKTTYAWISTGTQTNIVDGKKFNYLTTGLTLDLMLAPPCFTTCIEAMPLIGNGAPAWLDSVHPIKVGYSLVIKDAQFLPYEKVESYELLGDKMLPVSPLSAICGYGVADEILKQRSGGRMIVRSHYVRSKMPKQMRPPRLPLNTMNKVDDLARFYQSTIRVAEDAGGSSSREGASGRTSRCKRAAAVDAAEEVKKAVKQLRRTNELGRVHFVHADPDDETFVNDDRYFVDGPVQQFDENDDDTSDEDYCDNASENEMEAEEVADESSEDEMDLGDDEEEDAEGFYAVWGGELSDEEDDW